MLELPVRGKTATVVGGTVAWTFWAEMVTVATEHRRLVPAGAAARAASGCSVVDVVVAVGFATASHTWYVNESRFVKPAPGV